MPITNNGGQRHQAQASEREERDEDDWVGGEELDHCRHTRPVPLQALHVSTTLAASRNSPSN